MPSCLRALFYLCILTGNFIWLSPAEAANLRLNWKDISANESGFKIERLVGTAYVQIAIVATNAQSYTDAGLTIGATYCYRVKAFNSAGTSPFSNTACATAIASSSSTTGTTYGSTATTQLGSKWTDYRVTMKIRSTDNDSIGAMFRYQDNDNYYRFSWYAQLNQRRLEKRVGGVFKLLAEDQAAYKTGQTYALEVTVQRSSLKIRVDGKQIFSVTDTSFSEGTIALYSCYNAASTFDNISVVDLLTGNALLSDDFADGSHIGWTIIDEGSDSGPSQWSAISGVLTQASNIGSNEAGELGTYALYTKGSWKDYHLTAKVRSLDDDMLGIMFRYQDSDNYYRLSWNQQSPGRSLIKMKNGVVDVVAEDTVPYSSGQTYIVEILAQGASLKLNINGSPIFSVTDASFNGGGVALYSSYNQGSVFDDILVEDLSTGALLLWDDFNNGNLQGWTVIDDGGTTLGPSAWSVVNGELVQSSNIGSDLTGNPGTFVLY